MGLGMQTNNFVFSWVYYSEELIKFSLLPPFTPSFPPSLPPYIVIREHEVLEWLRDCYNDHLYMYIYIKSVDCGRSREQLWDSSLHSHPHSSWYHQQGAIVNTLIITHTHFTIMFYLVNYHGIVSSSSTAFELGCCVLYLWHWQYVFTGPHLLQYTTASLSMCTACSNTWTWATSKQYTKLLSHCLPVLNWLAITL